MIGGAAAILPDLTQPTDPTSHTRGRVQVFGDPASPTSKLIRELTYAEFCALAPINDAALSTRPAGAPAAEGLPGVPAGARGSSTLPGGRRLLRKLQNGVPASPSEPSLRAWDCTEEDHFPTLEEVRAACALGCIGGRGRERKAAGTGGIILADRAPQAAVHCACSGSAAEPPDAALSRPGASPHTHHHTH